MHVRRSVIQLFRGVVLSVSVTVLLAAGGPGAFAEPGFERDEVGGAVDSFRVQVYVTTERGAAESVRSEVRQWWSGGRNQAPSGVFGTDPPMTIEHAEPYYRVQVGNFSSRDQARRAQSFLARQYPDAFVVQRVPSERAAVSLPSAEQEGPPSGTPARFERSFQVQLYATTEREAARWFRSGVRQWWERATNQRPDEVAGADSMLTVEHEGRYYRVQMGAFSTRESARRARDFLRRQYPDAFITRVERPREDREGSTGEDRTVRPGATRTKVDSVWQRRMEAQGRDTVDTTFFPAAAWSRVREAARLVDRLGRDSVYTPVTLADLFEVGCAPVLPERARANALAREASHLDRNLGVEVEGRYGQRTTAILDETAGGLSGTYVGLEWDLLSQGLLGNRQRSNLLDARAQAERLTAELVQIQRTETCRARRVQERLRGMVPRLLEAKIEVSQDRQRLLRQAYLEGEALLDTFLEAKESVEEAERRLKILREEVHNEYDPAALDAFPPLPTLDFQALAQAGVGDSLRRELGRVERRLVALEEETTFDTRLSVFSRYTTTRTFKDRDVEFGLRLSQPLFGALFGNDGHAEAQRAELRRQEESRALSEQRENLRTVHRRFEEDQARAIRAHYRVAGRRERVRRRLGQRAIGGNERLNEALQDAETLIGAAIEKALAYGEVYEEVARAFSAAREPFDPVFLDTRPVTEYEQRGRAGQRALYIWSEAFRAHSNDFILELARARKIERLIVTAGHNTPMAKVRALRAQAREQDIATELLLASNHWVRPGGVERARTRIEALDLRWSALHLDVEPHTFDDFDQREDELLQRYLKVLRVARRTIGDDSELVVSVPLFWPDAVYRKIATIVDRVHLMAYGEKETRRRARQILGASRHFAPEQRVVALRPEDFAGPWALDRAISTLQEVVETDRFALHDLDTFLQFIEDEP